MKGKREKIQNGHPGIKSLKTRVGQECSICREGARLHSKSIQVRGVQGESHSITSRVVAGGQLQK